MKDKIKVLWFYYTIRESLFGSKVNKQPPCVLTCLIQDKLPEIIKRSSFDG